MLKVYTKGTSHLWRQIFQLQTAAFRAELEDFEFEYVQGTVPHTEGKIIMAMRSLVDAIS